VYDQTQGSGAGVFLTLWTTLLFFGIFFNSHLFWLNSHSGRACLVLRACRSVAFLDHDAKKGCEFKNFLFFKDLYLVFGLFV